jgi:DnaJ-class molecular chaperone
VNSYQCYQILGVQNDAPFKDVKSAYRNLALQFHPDKNTQERDGKKFKMITEAYQFLRKEYKRTLNVTRETLKYREKNSEKEHNFNSKKNWWGAKPADKPPEQDWGRYTRYTESAYQDFWKYYEKVFWENYEKRRGETIRVEQVEEPKVQKEQKVDAQVDKSKCIGCCSCEIIAPKVFSVDKLARINPKSSVINSSGASPERILDAAQTCPTKAISVTDWESKRQLFPW